MKEQEIISQAINILESRLRKTERYFTSSQDTKDFLRLKYADQEHESFNVMFLNSKHGFISLKEMFRGTVNASVVYPREVLKAAMQFNAAALVLSHNHPSGNCTPSESDLNITEKLQSLLSIVDITILDHIIVGGANTFSFAEHGYM